MADEPTPAPVDDRSVLERLLGDTEPIRRGLYPVIVAVVALLVFYGRLDPGSVPLWLALAVGVLGIGGLETVRRVAYAPATVQQYGLEWHAALKSASEAEYARGVAAGLECTPDRLAAELVDDEPGQHAVDRGEPTEALPAQEAPTGAMRAPSRATRCREVDDGRRCVLAREHDGPHHMTTA